MHSSINVRYLSQNNKNEEIIIEDYDVKENKDKILN
jgi:hypothetical protein